MYRGVNAGRKSITSRDIALLGQNFSKAFDVKFNNRDGKLEHVWSTSWGVSTRLMGALIMTHSDDQGLVLPPQLAPYQVVIVPIYKEKEEFEIIDKFCKKFKKIYIKKTSELSMITVILINQVGNLMSMKLKVCQLDYQLAKEIFKKEK